MDAKAATTFNDVRVKRELMKLKKEIREDKVAEDKLVERLPARRMFFEFATLVRTKFESMPEIGGPRLAAKYAVKPPTEHELVNDLTDLVTRMLTEIHDELDDPFGRQGDGDAA